MNSPAAQTLCINPHPCHTPTTPTDLLAVDEDIVLVKLRGSEGNPLPPLVVADDSVPRLAGRVFDVGHKRPHNPLNLDSAIKSRPRPLPHPLDAYHMDVEARVAVDPLILRGTDDEVERECIVQSFLLGHIEVSTVDVMEHCDEDLTLTSVHHCIMLRNTITQSQQGGVGGAEQTRTLS